MISDEIKDLMEAEPSRPIRIVLSEQKSYVVTHMDYLMISPDRKTIVFYDEQSHFRILNAPQIKVVEPLDRPPTIK